MISFSLKLIKLWEIHIKHFAKFWDFVPTIFENFWYIPVMSNGYFSKTLHFLPALFSSAAEAPASSNFLTTSKCPPSVAMWSGVESVTLLREFNTTFKSCFINSSTTPSEPFAAAICAQVLPSFKYLLHNVRVVEFLFGFLMNSVGLIQSSLMKWC